MYTGNGNEKGSESMKNVKDVKNIRDYDDFNDYDNNHNNKKSNNSKRNLSKSEKNKINNRFANITYVYLFIFLAMTAYLCYFLGFKSESFINNPYNPRINNLSDSVIRGDIKSSDGKVLATTVKNADGSLTRKYPYGDEFCHSVGYAFNGMSGIELDNNFELLRSHSFVADRVKNEISGKKSQGDTVVTTLDTNIQKACYDAITTKRGAAIVIEPETGKILAEVSKPSFDPNNAAENWNTISKSDDARLLNRVMQGKYPPGSTFKIATVLSYLHSGGELSDTYDCDGEYSKGGYTVHCAGNKSHGHQDVTKAFSNSCNVAFSQMGLKCDISDFDTITNELLFNKTLPGDFSNKTKSSFKLSEDDDAPMVMATSFGQGKTTVSPYHMALIASAIANNGELMVPYDVDHIENDEGNIVSSNSPKKAKSLMTSDDADTLKTLMRQVVTDGTAKGAFPDPSYTAYGKTGTAEYNSAGDTHSWFVGFAESDEKTVCICVLLEDTSSHAYTAASKILSACFD
jgi:peptidoglycan glycosyltransferase